MADKLSEQQLEAILAQQIELAKHDRKTGGRDASREKALDYFFGNIDKYVPPEPDRSKVVSRDSADTVNWMLPQIMRAFTASGRMFVAEPDDETDPKYAENASDGLNYVFWKENDGYKQVYDGTWDALVHGDAIVKTFYDQEPIYSAPRYHEGLSDDERAMLAGDDNADVLAQTENATQQPDPMTGQMVDAKSYDIKVRYKKANGRYVVDVIPPEEFLIDADATSLEDAAFKAHWQRKTRSALVAMGYDKDVVARIPEAARNETPEQQARNLFVSADATDTSMQMVDYFECFIMVDVDGDGVAEMVRACYAGTSNGKLLDWEVWEDEDPFDNIPCEPIPHRWDSRSLSDETIDITDVKTVLTRQMLNNTYWVNNPQPVVEGPGVSNPESLTDGQFGMPIFAKAGTTIHSLEREYIGDKALMGIHYMDEVSTRRTGVSNQSMALDPETLQNQSATANQNATDASRSQPEQIARNMAEFGWTKVGRKLLRLMTKHEDGPRTIQVKGKPVQIDPRSWNPDMHVTINVGLGTGSRDRDAAMLNTVLQQQIAFAERMVQLGFPEKALDMLPFIHNTLTKFCEATGLKNPEMYWPEIDAIEIEAGKKLLEQRAQQPDPKMAIAQMKAASDERIQQSEQRSNEIKAQAEAEKSTLEARIKLVEARAALHDAEQQLIIKNLEIAAKNDTDRWKAQLAAATTLQAAEISAGHDERATVLEAVLDSELSTQDHAQQMERAAQSHDNSMAQQAAAPKPQPGASA